MADQKQVDQNTFFPDFLKNGMGMDFLYSETDFKEEEAFFVSKQFFEAFKTRKLLNDETERCLSFDIPLPFDLKDIFALLNEESETVSFPDFLETENVPLSFEDCFHSEDYFLEPEKAILCLETRGSEEDLPISERSESEFEETSSNFKRDVPADEHVGFAIPTRLLTHFDHINTFRCPNPFTLEQLGLITAINIQNTRSVFGTSTKHYKKILSELFSPQNIYKNTVTKEDLLVFLQELHTKGVKIFIKYRILTTLLCLGPSTTKDIYDFVQLNYTDLHGNWKANIRYQLSVQELFYQQKGDNSLWFVAGYQ